MGGVAMPRVGIARGQEGRSMHKKKWDDAVYFMAQDLCIIAL